MSPSDEEINAQLEELVAKVQKDQQDMQKAARALRPDPVELEIPPDDEEIIEKPMAVARIEEEPETTSVAPAEEGSGGWSTALLGERPKDKVRTTAALAAGIAIGVASTSIIYGAALAGLGYGAYRFLVWRKAKRDPNKEEIIDTTAEIG